VSMQSEGECAAQRRRQSACRIGWRSGFRHALLVVGAPAAAGGGGDGKPEFVGCSHNYCAAASQGTAMRPWHGKGSLPAMAAA
jgi:hypothetical protein